MKFIVALLVFFTLTLQVRLWVGEGSLAEMSGLKARVENETTKIEILLQRNLILREEVIALRDGLDAIEERARSELGMIKKGETFYMLVKKGEAEKPPTRQKK